MSEPGIYSEAALLSSINQLIGAAGFGQVPLALAAEVLVCTMSLLQDVRFIDEQKSEVGKLMFVIAKKRIGLLGQIQISEGRIAAAAMLSTENRYYPFEPHTSQDAGVTPNTALTVVREHGRLRLESL